MRIDEEEGNLMKTEIGNNAKEEEKKNEEK